MADLFQRCFGEAGDKVEDEGAGKEEEDAGKCVDFSSSIRFSAWANFSCCMSVTFSPSSEIPTFLAAFWIV